MSKQITPTGYTETPKTSMSTQSQEHQGERLMELRASQQSDLPFLKQMLYEAVFWRNSPTKPAFEEAFALPEVNKSLADWGERDGDIAVVATIDMKPVGAAWLRYWTEDNHIRGYIEDNIPALVIAIRQEYRHQGIGGKMITWLIDYASKHTIPKISLMVSKDNYAINVYRQQGFVEYDDRGNSLLMLREIAPAPKLL